MYQGKKKKNYFRQANRKITQNRVEKNKFCPSEYCERHSPPEKKEGHVLFMLRGRRVRTFVLRLSAPRMLSPRNVLSLPLCLNNASRPRADRKRNRWNGVDRKGRGSPASRQFFFPCLCCSIQKVDQKFLGRGMNSVRPFGFPQKRS